MVNFDVEPVLSKGHVHGVHQGDKAGTLEVGGKAAASCTIPEGMTTCDSPVQYTAPQISGKEKITATLKDTQEEASKSIFIMVPDLGPLFATELYTLTGATGSHTENHYATNDTIQRIQGMAQDYYGNESTAGIRIRINDMNLPSGGAFDICLTCKTNPCYNELKQWVSKHYPHHMANRRLNICMIYLYT